MRGVSNKTLLIAFFSLGPILCLLNISGVRIRFSLFQNSLAEPEVKNKIPTFINSVFTDINLAARSLDEIYLKAADNSIKRCKSSGVKANVSKRSGLIQTYENSDIDKCHTQKFILIIQVILL